MTVPSSQHQKLVARQLERVVLAFLGGCAVFATGVYVFAPSIFSHVLLVSNAPTDPSSSSAALALLAILLVILVVMVGVLRHWQWLFWVLLLAFSFSILEIPATLLQWAKVIPAFPGPFPLWYSVCRMIVAVIEEGIAIWMLTISRRFGTW